LLTQPFLLLVEIAQLPAALLIGARRTLCNVLPALVDPLNRLREIALRLGRIER
jgi:hypothetical protein